MTQMELIEEQLRQLPPEKQREVLDFVSSLRQQVAAEKQRAKHQSLRDHPAFGSWRGRNIDAVEYQRALRAEWD